MSDIPGLPEPKPLLPRPDGLFTDAENKAMAEAEKLRLEAVARAEARESGGFKRSAVRAAKSRGAIFIPEGDSGWNHIKPFEVKQLPSGEWLRKGGADADPRTGQPVTTPYGAIIPNGIWRDDEGNKRNPEGGPLKECRTDNLLKDPDNMSIHYTHNRMPDDQIRLVNERLLAQNKQPITHVRQLMSNYQVDPKVLKPFRHQRQLIEVPWMYPQVEFFFLIGGYGCGKTSSDVFLILKFVSLYYKFPVRIGVGSSTITMLRKTLIAELEKYLIESGSRYKYDRNANIMEIGKLQLIFVAMDQPALIYAYNFSAFIGDELDELPQTKALEAFTAIQERCRVPFPDNRKPFSVFTTTAQGYRGTYQIIEELKEKGIPYVKIMGHTKDNLALPIEYVNRLYSIYNDNERMAFLEGKFVNLTSGRVYPGYDEQVHMVRDIEADPTLPIHIGQDLNAGFSKAVALQKRGRQLIVLRDWSFKDIGAAPKEFRRTYPFNKIYWYPDASSKEVMRGYQNEIRTSDLDIRMSSQNPSVLERIFLVNKLFQSNRLLLCKSAKDLSMGLKVRQFNDKGDPEKGRGEAASDHVCDSLEYVIFRILQSDPQFRDLWELTRSYRADKTQGPFPVAPTL